MIKVKADDLLKVSQTSIEVLLLDEKDFTSSSGDRLYSEATTDVSLFQQQSDQSPVDNSPLLKPSSGTSQLKRFVQHRSSSSSSSKRRRREYNQTESNCDIDDEGLDLDYEDGTEDVDDLPHGGMESKSLSASLEDESDKESAHNININSANITRIIDEAPFVSRVTQSRISRNSITSNSGSNLPDAVAEAEGGADTIRLDGDFKPYSPSNQLEYMEECFQVVALMIRGNAARLKDDMRKEGTKMNAWDYTGEVKHGRRELQV